MWIRIEQIDIGRLAVKLTTALEKWIAPENSYQNRVRLSPLLIMQHSSHFDLVLGLNVVSLKSTALVGYEAGYERYKWSSRFYEGIAESIVFDTLAGDYPIKKANFSAPDRITWVGGEDAERGKPQSMSEFLGYYQDLNAEAKKRIWINWALLLGKDW